MAHYEIGMVYRKGETYYLAVGRQLILAGSGGKVRSFECTDRFERAKSVSVALLCQTWGISTAELDFITSHYLSPLPRDEKKLKPIAIAEKVEEAEFEDKPASFIMAS